MATRNEVSAPITDDVRPVMIATLRARLRTADTRRITTADGRGWYESRADRMMRWLGTLERGDALTISSMYLPPTWRNRYQPPRRVRVERDGTVTAVPYRRR